MSQMIESMESRTLLSASATVVAQDFAALKGAADTAKADLTAALTSAAADVKAVKAAVAAAHPTPAQKKLLAAVLKDEKSAAAKNKQKIAKILASGTHDGTRLVALLKSLSTHPSNASLQAKAGAVVTALSGVFSTQTVATVESAAAAAVTGVETDLDAVAAAVPSAQAAVTTTEGHLNGDLTTLSTDATALQSAIAALAASLG